MKKRIKDIRKSESVNLNQEVFGKRLGVTGSTISRLESGDREPTEQIILSICREFNVDETWLRTGIGSMFAKTPKEDLYSKAVSSLLKDDDALAIEGLKLYYSLSPEAKKAATDYILKLADMIKEHKKTEAISDTTASNITENLPSVEEAEAEYIKSRLNAAKKTTSSASSITEENNPENTSDKVVNE